MSRNSNITTSGPGLGTLFIVGTLATTYLWASGKFEQFADSWAERDARIAQNGTQANVTPITQDNASSIYSYRCSNFDEKPGWVDASNLKRAYAITVEGQAPKDAFEQAADSTCKAELANDKMSYVDKECAHRVKYQSCMVSELARK